MDFLLHSIHAAEQGHRRDFRESGFALKNGSEAFKEYVWILGALLLQLWEVNIVVEGLIIGIHGVELTTFFRVGKYFKSLLNALEEIVVVCIT